MTIAPQTQTAPLPSAAVEALARLTPYFPLAQAAIEYDEAARRVAQLARVAVAGGMSDLDARSLADALADMDAAHATLDRHGRLDLIGGA